MPSLFSAFALGALLLCALELRASSGLRRRLIEPRFSSSWMVAALIVTYALQGAAVAYIVAHQPFRSQVPRFVPVPPVSSAIPHHDAVSAAMLALAAVQSYALLQLYRAKPPARLVWFGALLLAALSFFSPVMFTGDLYGYVGHAILGAAAWTPPAKPFPGDLGTINAWWGTPIMIAPYGPVWIGVSWLVTLPFGTLLGKLAALRALDVATFGCLLYVLRALGLPRRVVVVAALNPGLLCQYVVSSHNDLFGLTAIIASGLFVRTRPWAALLAMTAGGLVKLPLAGFALPMLTPLEPRWKRVAAAAIFLAAATAVTLGVGGAGIVRVLREHAPAGRLATAISFLVIIAAGALIIAAVFNKRRLLSALWLMPLVSPFMYPWYLGWGLPYAVTRRRVAGMLFVAFPFVSMLMDGKFAREWTILGIVPLIVAWQALSFLSRARPRASASPK